MTSLCLMTMALSCLFFPGPVTLTDRPPRPYPHIWPCQLGGRKGSQHSQYGRCEPSAPGDSCCLNLPSPPSDATGINSTSWIQTTVPSFSPFPRRHPSRSALPPHWGLWDKTLLSTLDLSLWPEPRVRFLSDVALSAALQIWLIHENSLWVSRGWMCTIEGCAPEKAPLRGPG